MALMHLCAGILINYTALGTHFSMQNLAALQFQKEVCWLNLFI